MHLSSVYTKDKFYNIVLGNGASIRFKDKKKIVFWLTHVNNNLTEALQELIIIYTDLFREYWQLWYYLDSYAETPEASERNKKIEAFCIKSFNYIPTLLNLAVNRSAYQNGNHFTFRHLYNAIDELQYITDLMLKLRRDKCHTAETNRLEIYLKNILRIKKEIDNIGKHPTVSNPVNIKIEANDVSETLTQ